MGKRIGLIALWTILLMLTAAARAEGYWQRAVVNYSRQQYHSGNQNWQAAQSKEGWMYFANNKGLLEFDGSSWQTYPLPGNAKVRAVRAYGDTIYVGALGQFGRFVRNRKGRLEYERLSESTDKGGQINIWNIQLTGSDIYYQSDDALYINDSKTRTACPPGIAYSTMVYNRLYAASSRGLFVLVGKEFQRVQGVDISQTSNIVSILPYGQGRLLLVSSDKGLWVYEDSHARQLHTAADGLIGAGRLSSAAICGDMLALGTMQDGVILLDMKKGTAEHMSINNGLQNKTVLSTTFDRDQNLWLGLDNGIDCIPLRSPLRFLNSRQSPIGSGYCSMAYNGKLYLGTNQGLYEMTGESIRFVKGTGSQVLCLDTVGGQLFCGGRRFFLTIDGERITHYDNRGVWGVRSFGHRSDVLLTASYWGLRLMRRQGQDWVMAEEVKGTDISAKTFYVEEGSTGIWVANKEKGIFRLTLSEDLTRVKSKRCYNSDLLPKGDNVSIASIDGETVVASRQGLFRYDATHDRLEPHTTLEKRLEGHTAYTYIRQDRKGCIWYAADGTLHLVRGEHNDGYLNDWLMEDFESVCLEGQRAVIGTEDGFVSLQLDGSWRHTLDPSQGQTASPHNPPHDPRPYIRKVYVGNYADTLFYGCELPVTIKWRDNSMRFECSAINYDPAKSVLYSYWLEGSAESGYGPYARRRIKEYTNLEEGCYIFHVRIITSGSNQPAETQFAFVILPPWYRTWWAYVLYALLTAALAWMAWRRLQRSRQQLIEQKDEQIQEREVRIQEREEEIATLREEKLEIELRSKQDELVRSRMNIVRKNEMLQDIRKTAISLNNSLSEENLPASKRRIVRLIGQIDTNIEHDEDLDAFRDSFDAVHHNFLQILGERYPELSHKDKMLCAYIRMNLLSKEIAPLLNISTRGVEISRYRLRQKLGLDSKESLTEFLRKI
jgi:ligand-binding sensor domain-containing protein/DNA-binding CsgD family transcriptional regulator